MLRVIFGPQVLFLNMSDKQKKLKFISIVCAIFQIILIFISAYNFNNESHREYNEWFYEKERDGAQGGAYNYKLSQCLESEETKNFINSTFGKEYLKYL